MLYNSNLIGTSVLQKIHSVITIIKLLLEVKNIHNYMEV